MRRLGIVIVLLGLMVAGLPGTSEALLGPSNDNRADAKVVTSGSFDQVDTTLATDEPGEQAYCGVRATVWYRVTAETDGIMVISTADSDFDTAVVAYDASDSSFVRCNDDSSGRTSLLKFPVEARETYEIQAGGWARDTGNLHITFALTDPPPPPPNDRFSDPMSIESLPFSASLDLSQVTQEEDEPTHCNAGRSLWYSFTAGEERELILSASTSFPSVLVVYDQAHFPRYSFCSDRLTWSPRLRFYAEAGTTYLIQVAPWNDEAYEGDTGRLDLHGVDQTPGSIDDPGPPSPPVTTSVGSLPFTANQATNHGTERVQPCGQVGSAVWYSYTPDIDRTIRVDTLGSDFDTVVALYESESWPRSIACNDNLDTERAALEFTAQAGRTYYFQVGGRHGATGQLNLNVAQVHAGFPSESWAEIDIASIRPGVRLFIEGNGWCTSNFIFRGAGLREGRVYIGTAGHCTEGALGAAVHMPSNDDAVLATRNPGPVIGHVAYSSWDEEGLEIGDCTVVLCSVHGTGNRANDFALIEVRSERRDDVNPAVLHYGGPTGVVDWDDIEIGATVLSFGNSVLRPGPEQLDHREGWVKSKSQYTTYVRSPNPGIWGDSGSDALLGDGRALGVVVTISFNDGTNGVAILSEVLDYADQRGWEVEIGTWELLRSTALPPLPVVP